MIEMMTDSPQLSTMIIGSLAGWTEQQGGHMENAEFGRKNYLPSGVRFK